MSKNEVEDDIAAIFAGPAFRNTDDASADLVLAAVKQCAASWHPEARILGNVRAVDIVRAVTEVLTQLHSPYS